MFLKGFVRKADTSCNVADRVLRQGNPGFVIGGLLFGTQWFPSPPICDQLAVLSAGAAGIVSTLLS